MPVLQPAIQHRVWERFQPGEGPGRLAAVIGELSAEDGRFNMDGGSWTNNVSWVRGYQNVLAPMQRAGTLSASTCWPPACRPATPVTGDALFHLLACETSCYRYWGQGIWTGYGIRARPPRQSGRQLTSLTPPRSPSRQHRS